MQREDIVVNGSQEEEARPRTGSEAPEVSVNLADLWPHLAQGSYLLVDHFFSSERCYVALRKRASVVSQAQRELLRRLVLGHQQKAIALDLDITAGAVALRVRRCIHCLGLKCRPGQLPLFVIMSGIAFHGGPTFNMTVRARIAVRVHQGEELQLCSFTRPDMHLPNQLSEAEQAVARMLVEGGSQAQIADRRGTTTRTAGNQVGAVFAKLGVSGRIELIHFLAKRAASRTQ